MYVVLTYIVYAVLVLNIYIVCTYNVHSMLWYNNLSLILMPDYNWVIELKYNFFPPFFSLLLSDIWIVLNNTSIMAWNMSMDFDGKLMAFYYVTGYKSNIILNFFLCVYGMKSICGMMCRNSKFSCTGFCRFNFRNMEFECKSIFWKILL